MPCFLVLDLGKFQMFNTLILAYSYIGSKYRTLYSRYLYLEYYLIIFSVGICTTVGAVIGIIGNGVLIRIFNLDIKQCLYLYLAQAICGCLVTIPYFILPCPNRPLNGLIDQNRQIIEPPNLSNEYNTNCSCIEDVFSPYCIEDGNGLKSTYFSVS